MVQQRRKAPPRFIGKRTGRLPEQSHSPLRLLLQIGGRQTRTVSLPVADRVLVGRGGGDETADVLLDLAAFDGEACGVSRQHAALCYHNGRLTVEDVGSKNGTRLNGLPLTPHKPYALRSGDELALGSLCVTVRLHVGKV